MTSLASTELLIKMGRKERVKRGKLIYSISRLGTGITRPHTKL